MFCREPTVCCKGDEPEIEVQAIPGADDVQCMNEDARIQVLLPTEQEMSNADVKLKSFYQSTLGPDSIMSNADVKLKSFYQSTLGPDSFQDAFVVEFRDTDGAPKHISFTPGQRLGIGFKNDKPATVGQVLRSSVAEAKGVKCGWKLLRIAEEDVTQIELEDVLSKFEALASRQKAPLSLDKVTMVFQADSGEKRPVVFKTSPLKMGFSMQRPRIVDQIDSTCIAYKEGVRAGWKILSLDGEKIETMDWRHVLEKIKRSARALPGAVVD